MKEIERPFVFSSTDGIAGSKPGDFTIKHIPNLILDKNKEHCIALDKFNGHYSWYNINSTYNNNKNSYSHDSGKTSTIITFPDGIYDYDDLKRLPNITNSVDNLKIKTSVTFDSLDGGVSTDVLYSFDTSDTSRAFPLKIEPRRRLYNKLNTNIISSVRIYMTDAINRPIDFNEIPVSLTVVIKSVDKCQ